MGVKEIAATVLNTVTGGVLEKVFGIVDKAVSDKDLAAQIKERLETLRTTQSHEDQMAQVQLLLGQIEVNKTEAASPSLFVAGWRPFIGWTCGVGIAYAFIVHPLALFIAYLCHVDLDKMPALDVGTLMSLVLSMLGVATLRTYEKKQGVAAVNLKSQLQLE